MEFNSAFKGLKLLKKPGNGHLNNLNDPVLNVLKNLEARPMCHIATVRFVRHVEPQSHPAAQNEARN